MLHIAYIGNGKSVNRYHAPFVLTRPDAWHIQTIYDRHVNTPKWPHLEGVHYTDQLEDIWQDDRIDLVVVSTGVDSHFEYGMQALKHGKNVLIEKPMTRTYQEAKMLFYTAKRKGLFVQCYQNRRFDADYLTTLKVIESGKLGEIYEVDMHFDYYRPEVPQNAMHTPPYHSFLYGHGCHTIDQVIAYWGKPQHIHYDVQCLCGMDHMNDYFDVDLYYPGLKVSVKSSYFRIKPRPSFVVYGKRGMFIKEKKDRQEEHLKLFYMPGQPDFGLDRPEDYGTLTYLDEKGIYHEEKIVSEQGDYARIYDGIEASLLHQTEKLIKDEETLTLMEILETGIKQQREGGSSDD